MDVYPGMACTSDIQSLKDPSTFYVVDPGDITDFRPKVIEIDTSASLLPSRVAPLDAMKLHLLTRERVQSNRLKGSKVHKAILRERLLLR